KLLALATAPGRHVLENRLLAEIKFHHVGKIAVHRLVVGNAGPHCIGKRDIACLIRGHQPRHAKRRIRTEGKGIEKVVVEASVNHIHTLRTLRGAPEYALVATKQIASLDELDAKLVGEE